MKDNNSEYKLLTGTAVEFSVLASRLGCKSDNRRCQVKSSGMVSQISKALDTVHLRHEMIHEYDVVEVLKIKHKHFFSAIGLIYGHSGL